MPTINPNVIEAFLIDNAFLDRSKTINEFLLDEVGRVCALTPKALSYFSKPSAFQDKRDAGSRVVSWFPETTPAMVVDEDTYTGFVDNINNLTSPVSSGFFKLVDRLTFNYDTNQSAEDLESILLGDPEISAIYVPDSFVLSASLIEGTVYLNSGTELTVEVPSFIKFGITITTGSTPETYTITLFTSVEAWLSGYDISTIVKIIPPLPYNQLYSDSLINSEANVFSTAAMTATLSYNTTNALLGNVTVSGITEYVAIVVDLAGSTAAVPFNILYKGRSPTLSEIREAIRTELLTSGSGTAEGWELRIPGVFVAGRFYLIPFWDMTYEKPDQVLFPSVSDYTTMGTKLNQILDSTAFGDLRDQASIVSVYYNRMTLAAVPDLTGIVDIQKLSEIIPDYQNYSPDDENFAYMTELSKAFAEQINQVLALDTTNTTSDDVAILTENLLTFYSFVVGKFEMCVITKLCYNTIMESTQ